MSNANRHDIHVLNGLIGATLDSADGYRDAAAGSADPGHRELFERRAVERRRLAEELGSTVRDLGGEPHADGSILAKAQRAFADVRHALMRDELSVVGAVETAEDQVKARFEKAVDDPAISATTRDTIRRAWDRIRDGHDQMRDLKHSLQGQRDAASGLFPR
jgi:uncharacterized protein (TIGR02284 family)